MEPISTTILTALSLGVGSGLKDTAGKAITDAYTGVKSLIARKCGSDSTAVEALNRLEKTPDSKGWQEDLTNDLTAHQADHDADILAAVRLLQDALAAGPQQNKVTVIGDGNAIGGNHATITLTNTFNAK